VNEGKLGPGGNLGEPLESCAAIGCASAVASRYGSRRIAWKIVSVANSASIAEDLAKPERFPLQTSA
jgi:hypothetical protein